MSASLTGVQRWRVTALIGSAVLAAGCAASHSNGSRADAANDRAGSPSPSSATTGAASSGSPSNSPTPLPPAVLASWNVASGPVSGVGAFGSMWITTHRNTVLYRINPTTNRIIAKIDIGIESCFVPVDAGGRIVVSECAQDPKQIIVNPQTNQVTGGVPATGPLTVDGSDVWSMSPDGNSLVEYDPRTLKVVRKVVTNPYFWVFGDQHLWVANGNSMAGEYDGRISEIDPTTGRTVRSFATPQAGSYPTMWFYYGYIWMKGGSDSRLLRVDPHTGASTVFRITGYSPLSQQIDVYVFPGFGSLWFRTDDGTVSRIDPHSGSVVATYPADPAGGGGDTIVAFGSLWIANFATDTVWRDRIGA